MTTLILYAPNVASSGGIVLLRALIAACSHQGPVTLMLDVRAREMIGEIPERFCTHWFRSSVSGRFRAEILLRRISKRGDIVFCFHNLPPILSNKGRVVCYLHNANLVGLVPEKFGAGWVKLRHFLERTIAWIRKSTVERYVVQTPTMEAAVREWFGVKSPPVDALPFIGDRIDPERPRRALIPAPAASQGTKRWDFIYVSDGSAHKNHRRLFQAWANLASADFYPTLAVTLEPSRNADLIDYLREIVSSSGAKIENLGQLPHGDVLALYSASSALIFPSVAESFGVPLIEAQSACLPILASELDYVRDVCCPAETFDPNSARSIARAVRRFMTEPEPVEAPMSAAEFWSELMHRL